MSNGLINKQIKGNIIKVSEQPTIVRSALNTSVSYTKATNKPYKFHDIERTKYLHQADLSEDIKNRVMDMTRDEKLNTMLILATSRNQEAQSVLLRYVTKYLGVIKDEDYHKLAKYIYTQPKEIADKINRFLSKHLQGYSKFYQENYVYYYL